MSGGCRYSCIIITCCRCTIRSSIIYGYCFFRRCTQTSNQITSCATSPELLSPIEIVGAGSSSTIVIVAEPAVVLIVALSGEDNVKVNVSSSSSVVSDNIAMLTVLVKSPGLNVRGVADIAV